MPSAVLGTLNLTEQPMAAQVQVLEVEVEVTPSPEKTSRDESFREGVAAKAEQSLEDALDSLRLMGASEQQLGALMGATRLMCLLRLLDEDLDGVFFQYWASHGATISAQEQIAKILVPELHHLL